MRCRTVVLAATLQTLSSCALLILSSSTAVGLVPEPPSRGWIIELSPQERQSVVNLLQAGQFTQLDQRYGTFQRQYEQGQMNDRDLTLQYQAFYDTSPENEAYLNQWVTKNSKSYPARLARGIYNRKLGEKRRGFAFAKDTPPENMVELSKYLAMADKDLVDSLSLSKKPIVTLLHLVNSSMMRGDKERSLAWLNFAKRIDPVNYGVRRRYLLTLTPRWGGSYDEMWRFLKACQDQRTSAEYLRIFESEIYLDQAKSYAESDQREKALPLYRKALSLLDGIDNTERLDALKGVVYNGANPTNLEEFSREIDETLRLAPTESMILGYRGWIRFKQGRIEEGIKDYSMAAELGDAYSQFQHGQQLFYGVPSSLTPNRNQGLLWITKAAEQGDEAAKQFLKQVGEKQ